MTLWLVIRGVERLDGDAFDIGGDNREAGRTVERDRHDHGGRDGEGGDRRLLADDAHGLARPGRLHRRSERVVDPRLSERRSEDDGSVHDTGEQVGGELPVVEVLGERHRRHDCRDEWHRCDIATLLFGDEAEFDEAHLATAMQLG